MSDKPAMTAEEKRCLTVANAFLKEAKTLKFRQDGLSGVGADMLAINGVMLGELAADKYRDCMRQGQQPAPRR